MSIVPTLDFPDSAVYVHCAVKKLPEVEDARALMREAADWSVFKWLFEKRKVREAADQANAALDELSQAIKKCWGSDLKAAYKQSAPKAGSAAAHRQQEAEPGSIDAELRCFAQKVRQADEAAQRARLAAENTFEEAERQLNTDLAREGCRQAIHSWELLEKAIRIAEAVPDIKRKS
jgi:hypothetical protein